MIIGARTGGRCLKASPAPEPPMTGRAGLEHLVYTGGDGAETAAAGGGGGGAEAV